MSFNTWNKNANKDATLRVSVKPKILLFSLWFVFCETRVSPHRLIFFAHWTSFFVWRYFLIITFCVFDDSCSFSRVNENSWIFKIAYPADSFRNNSCMRVKWLFYSHLWIEDHATRSRLVNTSLLKWIGKTVPDWISKRIISPMISENIDKCKYSHFIASSRFSFGFDRWK